MWHKYGLRSKISTRLGVQPVPAFPPPAREDAPSLTYVYVGHKLPENISLEAFVILLTFLEYIYFLRV